MSGRFQSIVEESEIRFERILDITMQFSRTMQSTFVLLLQKNKKKFLLTKMLIFIKQKIRVFLVRKNNPFQRIDYAYISLSRSIVVVCSFSHSFFLSYFLSSFLPFLLISPTSYSKGNEDNQKFCRQSLTRK